MRLMGLILLIAAGGGCGFMMAARLRRRAQMLELAVRWVRHLQTEFRFRATPLSEALTDCAALPVFRELSFLRTAAVSPDSPITALAREIRENATTLALIPDDVQLLTQLCAGLGTTDLEGQLAHLEVYAGRLELQHFEALGLYRRKGQVCRVLGISAAAAAALVLW